jgi:class 3 adenylate cyclase
METEHHRTVICSVVFLDIVAYSTKSVSWQERVKTRFNEIVAQAVEHYDPSERTVLDTGDGAALCFTGDPEDALFVAIDLRNTFAEELLGDGQPFPGVRIGINLGPVRALHDLNGNRNLIGDAINIGQRIMSFSEPGQILVSRAYYEVVSCLSTSHAALFQYVGLRHDKHVREHVVYEVRMGAQDLHDPTVEPIDGRAAAPLELSDEERAALEGALTRSVGPMAHLVVQQALPDSPTFDALVQRLAGAVPAGPERQAFLAHFRPASDSAVVVEMPAPASTGPASGAPTWTDAELAAAEHALAKHLGPLAHYLVLKASTRCHTLAELYEALAAEIHDPTERAHFLAGAPVRR